MADRDSLERGGKAAQELEKIEQINDLLKTYFSKFDERIINTLRKYVFQENGMRILFKKLNISMPNNLNQQLEAISKFLTIQGESAFRKKILFSGSETKFKIEPIIHISRSPQQEIVPSVEPQTKQPPSEQIKTPPFQTAPPPKSPMSPVIETPLSQPIQQPTQQEPQTGEPPPQQLTWPQIDRRSGKDRRQNPDRRRNIEVIFKNKRYGSDRRSGIERRKNWPPNGLNNKKGK